MGDKSKIEWTDATWNVCTGCTKVSAGCAHCYAERQFPRVYGNTDWPTYDRKRKFTDVSMHHERLFQPLRWKRPRWIFVCSMGDLFHEDVPDEFIARVWQMMSVSAHHVFQVLTKRPERMLEWVVRWHDGLIPEPYDVRDVVGYPGYRVSSTGVVYGIRSDTTQGLSCDVGQQGHCRVTMHREGSPRSGERELVHRLALTAFVRPPKKGEQACHRNGDPTDNRLSNLYWGTQSDNWRDRVDHGNHRSYAKLTEQQVNEMRVRADEGVSVQNLAALYNVSDTQIRNILSGRQWSKSEHVERIIPPRRAVAKSVWLGTSVENQETANERIPLLLQTPAAVRFVSAEPLLGPVDFRLGIGDTSVEMINNVLDGTCVPNQVYRQRPEDMPGMVFQGPGEGPRLLHWIIVGGESGPKARPMHPDWVRSIRDQCAAAGVPMMFKQWGEHVPVAWPIREDGTRADIIEKCEGDYGGEKVQAECFAGQWMARVGKKKAGRLLDGQIHDEYPETTTR